MTPLTGFATIGVVIGVGWLLARVGVLTVEHRRLMSNLAFHVGSPALLCSLMATADLERVFARSVLASYGAILAAGLAYLVIAAFAFRHSVAGRTIGTLLACYSNAGNLGLPVAAYALGDVTWIVPILLIQIGVLQPIGLTILDASTARQRGAKTSGWWLATLPFRNPLTVGMLVGLVINLTGWTLPSLLADPLTMVGNTAVPLMLLAFGVSLRLDPRPAERSDAVESWCLTALKVFVQPAVAWALAMLLGLDPVARHAVTVVAALPPAQNIFVFASRYGVRLAFARDTIFRSTIVSAAVVLVVASVLV